MSSVSSSAAAGALQLALELQQNLASNVASMGGTNNPALSAGQALATLDAGGTAAGLNGVSSQASSAVNTYA